MSTLHFTAIIKQILPQEVDPTLQKPFVRNLYLVEEYGGGQYPERAIISVYDKDGQGSCWNKILEKLGHFPAVEQPGQIAEPFEVYFHLDAAAGVSSKTGNAYAIQKPLSVWYFDKPEQHEPKPAVQAAGQPCAYSVPGYCAAPQQQAPAAAPQPSSPQPQYQNQGYPAQNNPFQQFAPREVNPGMSY